MAGPSFSGKVFHGSGTVFEQFDPKTARIANDYYGGGISYFTSNRQVAETYAKSMSKKTKTPHVFTCQLRLRKYFDVDQTFFKKELLSLLPPDLDKFCRGAKLFSGGVDKYVVLAQLELGVLPLTGEQIFQGLSQGMNQTASARAWLEKKGFDGLRYNGGVNMNMATKHDVWLAYKPESIKILSVERI